MQFNRQLSRPHDLNFDILITEEVCLHLHKTQISLRIHTTLRFCTTDEAEEGWRGGLHKDAKEQLTKWKVYFGDEFDGGQTLMKKEQGNGVRDISAQLYEHSPV